MKLSEKGFNKIVNNLLHLCKLKFESDDFEDGCFQNGKGHLVCLTVDEVFTLKQMVKWVLKSSSLGVTNTVFLEETYKILNKHFKQAEKCDE